MRNYTRVRISNRAELANLVLYHKMVLVMCGWNWSIRVSKRRIQHHFFANPKYPWVIHGMDDSRKGRESPGEV